MEGRREQIKNAAERSGGSGMSCQWIGDGGVGMFLLYILRFSFDAEPNRKKVTEID